MNRDVRVRYFTSPPLSIDGHNSALNEICPSCLCRLLLTRIVLYMLTIEQAKGPVEEVQEIHLREAV